jgi:hypothetical protein
LNDLVTKGTHNREVPLPRNILNPHGEELVSSSLVSKTSRSQPSIPAIESRSAHEGVPILPTSPYSYYPPTPPHSTTSTAFPTLPSPTSPKVAELIIRYDSGETQRLVPEKFIAEELPINSTKQASNSAAMVSHQTGKSNEKTYAKKHVNRIPGPPRRPPPGRKFRTPMELIILLRECKDCTPKRRFESRREAFDHQKNCHNVKYCPVCFDRFTRRGNVLKDHFLKFHATNATEEMALCPFCKMSCNYEGIYQHISKRHLVPAEQRFPYDLDLEYNSRARRVIKLGQNWDKDDEDSSSDEPSSLHNGH